MKKIYATGIALFVGLSAMAAPQSASMSQMQVLKSATAEMGAIEAPAAMSKLDGKAITGVGDLVGLGKIVGEDVSGIGNEINMIVGMEEKNATTLTLTYFLFYGNDCDVKVDAAAGTVTFANNTPLGQVNTSSGFVATSLFTCEYLGQEDGKAKFKNIQEIVATIDENNNIVFPENRCLVLGYLTPDNKISYFTCVLVDKIEKLKENTPVSLEGYQTVGTAKFSDGWFNTYIVGKNGPAINDSEVTVMRNPAKPKELVICNPYADSRWVEFGRAGDGTGYLIVDYSYEDCVIVVPYVQCGMNMEDEEYGKTIYYLNNQEGLNVFNGYDQEAQIEDNEIAQEDMSNVSGNTMTIYNLFFGQKTIGNPEGDVDEPFGTYWWTNGTDASGKPIFMDVVPSVIELPEGWREGGEGGVNGITVDNEVAPRYYNLQGVEIAAPVKGQLTIKKEGNKAVKFIAR